MDEKMGNKQNLKFPTPPKFDDPYKERAYLKGRLAAAFRIFGKCGFDEGVAGHITLRVSLDCTSEANLANGGADGVRTPLTLPPFGSTPSAWRSA